MSNTQAPALKNLTAKELFNQDSIKQKFNELLGQKSRGFITSVLQIVTSNDLLKNADPMSIYNAAAVAATLDLPLNNNLGFAYIVPYNARQKDGSYKQVAQFQLGYKGYIQLAQRSGQFRTISATPIFEGQVKSENPLTGFEFDFTVKSDKIVGYAAYFELLNGFTKTFYMTAEEMKQHGSKFSQTYKKGFGVWKDDFDSMAIKTVIKLLLSKFAPLSIEMQTAVVVDQAVLGNDSGTEVEYADHEEVKVDKEAERKLELIGDCTTLDELEVYEKSPEFKELSETIEAKKKAIQNGKSKHDK